MQEQVSGPQANKSDPLFNEETGASLGLESARMVGIGDHLSDLSRFISEKKRAPTYILRRIRCCFRYAFGVQVTNFISV